MLLFSRICEKVSLYGFTTYNTNAPDQYTGRKKKAHRYEAHAASHTHAAHVPSLLELSASRPT